MKNYEIGRIFCYMDKNRKTMWLQVVEGDSCYDCYFENKAECAFVFQPCGACNEGVIEEVKGEYMNNVPSCPTCSQLPIINSDPQSGYTSINCCEHNTGGKDVQLAISNWGNLVQRVYYERVKPREEATAKLEEYQIMMNLVGKNIADFTPAELIIWEKFKTEGLGTDKRKEEKAKEFRIIPDVSKTMTTADNCENKNIGSSAGMMSPGNGPFIGYNSRPPIVTGDSNVIFPAPYNTIGGEELFNNAAQCRNSYNFKKDDENVPDYFTAKKDQGKLRMDLVPPEVEEAMAAVLTFGTQKGYVEDSWKDVPDAEKRYMAAALRHFTEYRKGLANGKLAIDPESGLSHLHHALTNLGFLVYFENKRRP